MALTFADILNTLADRDEEIIRLEAGRTHAVGDANEIARLDEVVSRFELERAGFNGTR